MNIHFSKKELQDLLKAWLVISIAFGIVLRGNFDSLTQSLIISTITVGTGFVLHELGHKIVAQRYGCFAEFRSFDFMLFLAFIMSFFGFVFAAPGAVMIRGHMSLKRNGLISLAGPVVNLVLAIIFLGINLLNISPFWNIVGNTGLYINAFLAVFNLIPFGPFDGKKIFTWNKNAWYAIAAVAFVMFVAAS